MWMFWLEGALSSLSQQAVTTAVHQHFKRTAYLSDEDYQAARAQLLAAADLSLTMEQVDSQYEFLVRLCDPNSQ